MSTEPTDLAPHVDAGWVDSFVIELRLRDVPGEAIGDALVEVESHVVDSGTTARDAFGDPVAYAAQVAEVAGRPEPDRVRDALPALVGTAGLVLAASGALGWWRDGTVELTGATVGILVGMSLLVVVLTRFGTSVLRALLTRPWRFGLAFGAANLVIVLLAVAGHLWWHIGTVPAAPVTLVGVALTGVSALLHRARPVPLDPITAPGGDRAAAQADARREARRVTLRVTVVQVGCFVALAVVVGLAVGRGA